MNINVLLHDGWQRLKSIPSDPPESVSFGKITSSSQCFALIFPIDTQRAMPFNDTQSIIEGIHQSLGDNQALIEVDNGNKSFNGQFANNRFIYSIIKTRLDLSGVQYFVRANIKLQNGVIEVNAFFDEVGTTGVRDATILGLMKQQGLNNLSQWMRDPYDSTLQRPCMMNLSEKEQYDSLFPDHPLSQARRLVHILREY